jgi:hypothetical protein
MIKTLGHYRNTGQPEELKQRVPVKRCFYDAGGMKWQMDSI